jgi:hypothetical protein
MSASRQDDDRGVGIRRRLAVWGGAAALMALPVVAIRATEPVPSDPRDFVFLAILLAGLGTVYEVAARVTDHIAYLAAAGIAIAAALLNVWINLAVGVIGSEDNPANMIYFAVLAVAAAGAILARFRPLGMARAMVVTAIAQAAAFAIVLAAGLGFTWPITVFFAGLWLISAWLFRKAARGRLQAEAVA